MKNFKNILVYFDTSSEVPQKALEEAIQLAHLTGAKITLMDVLENFSWQVVPNAYAPTPVPNMLKDDVAEKLDDVLRAHEKHYVELDTRIAEGDPSVELVREVLRGGHDIVYKTAMGDATRRGRIFGNTGIRLMRRCPCPVMLVKPYEILEAGQVVAAINTHAADVQHNDLNKSIVEYAHALAQLSKAELSIIQAWTVSGESLLAMKLSEGALHDHVAACRKDIQQSVNNFSHFAPEMTSDDEVHLLQGPAYKVIPHHVKHTKASMLVMGSVARMGIPGLLVGNTAEQILEQVDCSVLLLKPEGFISPISATEHTADDPLEVEKAH
jgi:nucleotide-binding universal stress UspA family protein